MRNFIQKVSSHTLQHSFATGPTSRHLLEGGRDIYTHAATRAFQQIKSLLDED